MSDLDFTYTEEPQVHRERRREIVRRHPEIRELGGPHVSTPIAIVALVAIQLVAAWLVRDLGIPLAYPTGQADVP